MVTANYSHQKLIHLLFPAILLLLFMHNSANSQSRVTENLKLSDSALNFYHLGLNSENLGVKKSLIYFAGKYKIEGVCDQLVEILKNTEDEELCEMLVWSIYQINDEFCGQEMKNLLKTHPIRRVREDIQFFNIIKEYENALVLER